MTAAKTDRDLECMQEEARDKLYRALEGLALINKAAVGPESEPGRALVLAASVLRQEATAAASVFVNAHRGLQRRLP